MRDYGCEGQIGLEDTPEQYVNRLADVFDEVKRVLKKDGTLWLVIGDSYATHGGCKNSKHKHNFRSSETAEKEGIYRAKPYGKQIGLKEKDLIGIPWMVAFELRKRGWWLRQDIIWAKGCSGNYMGGSAMPGSYKDRCTTSHEYVFLLSKSAKYYYDYEAIKEEATGYDGRKDTLMKGSDKYKTSVVPGQAEHTMAARGHERWEFKDGIPMRNKRSVWCVNLRPYKGAHFAVFPPKLIIDMIKAGCPEKGIVLDPFIGAGTTAIVSRKLDRNYIGIDLSEKYVEQANERIDNELGMFK